MNDTTRTSEREPAVDQNGLEGWTFPPTEIKAAIASGRMVSPSIELTNACNLNCGYCYIEEKTSSRKLRRPDELAHQDIVALIEDMRQAGARSINIVGAGEPTIDPHFQETVDLIARSGMTTILFTNGIRLKHEPALLPFLYDRNVTIVLKFNSLDPEVQDLVAGRAGYSAIRDEVLAALMDYGFAAHQPTRLGVDIIIFRGNLGEVAEIHDWCRRRNIFPIAGDYIPTGRTEGGSFQGHASLVTLAPGVRRAHVASLLEPLDPPERDDLVRSIAANDLLYGIRRHSNFAYYGGGTCVQILGLYVDIAGNIWPCVARKRREAGETSDGWLGNVRRGDRASTIWRTHPYLAHIRSTFSGGCPYKAPLLA